MRTRQHIELPDIPSRYVLNPERGAFSLVVPEATTNLITNPSFETNTTNWTAVVASIARSATQQRYGAYSLAITMTTGTGDGAYYGTISLTSGTTYTASMWVYAPPGMPLKLYFATTAGVTLMTTRFIGIGRWQRVIVTYAETSTTTRRVYITKDASTRTGVVYIDGAQVEAKSYPTTYCDGDQPGLVPNQFPPAYSWSGTPHASTSTRISQTRAGGRIYNLDQYGFRVIGHSGLGKSPRRNVVSPYSQLDGGEYQGSRKESRMFSIVGRFGGATPARLDRQRSDLYEVLDRDAVGLDQPLTLLYREYDCLDPVGDEVTIVAVYQSGLEGVSNNSYAEDVNITFMMPDPVTSSGSYGTSLSVVLSVSDADYIIKRGPTGLWAALGTGMNAVVRDIVVAPDGSVYAGGDFTDAGGVAANRIAKWDGSVWTALGTGMDASVLGLAIAPNGNLYAAGLFTTAGGVAVARIAVWDGSVWAALGAGLDAQCNDIVVAPDGSLYACGLFLNAGGAGAVHIAKWDGSAWSALSTGLTGGTGIGAQMAIGIDGLMYVCGFFTVAGGVTVNGVAKWSGTAFSALSTGLSAVGVNDITIAPDGNLYVVGLFTVAGGVAANRIAKWNGASWSALGAGLASSSVLAVQARRDSTILIGESPSGLLFATDDLSIWNGTTYVLIDVDLPGAAPNPRAFAEAPDGTLYVGYNTTGSANAITNTTLTYPGTARSYPRITIKGPTSGTARIHQISNFTSNKHLYFDLTINAGETITLDLRPKFLSAISDFRGNVLGTILGGSNRSEMYILRGNNVWGALSSDSTVTITLYWDINLDSVSDAIY